MQAVSSIDSRKRQGSPVCDVSESSLDMTPKRVRKSSESPVASSMEMTPEKILLTKASFSNARMEMMPEKTNFSSDRPVKPSVDKPKKKGKNDEGADVFRGLDEKCNHLFYCSRYLGKTAIPESDGRCGPSNGPQCSSCQRFQASKGGAKPKTPKEKRVQMNLELLMVGASGVSLKEGDMVVIKRARSLQDEKTLGVFDALMGVHVGWLQNDVLSILDPWLASHRRVCIKSCRVLGRADDSTMDGRSKVQTDVADQDTAVRKDVDEARAETMCTRLEAVFSAPLSQEDELHSLRQRLFV